MESNIITHLIFIDDINLFSEKSKKVEMMMNELNMCKV